MLRLSAKLKQKLKSPAGLSLSVQRQTRGFYLRVFLSLALQSPSKKVQMQGASKCLRRRSDNYAAQRSEAGNAVDDFFQGDW